MGRKRKKDNHLPACMYYKHGSYYLVKSGAWLNLGKDLPDALHAYANALANPANTMEELLLIAHQYIISKVHSKHTVEQYAGINRRLIPIFKEFSPDQVLPKHIGEIKRHYLDRQPMFNRIISYLKQVFDYGLEHGIIEKNPCERIKSYPEVHRDRYITHDEYLKIYEAATLDFKAILAILYLTSQRIDDVLNIQMEQITEEGIYFRQGKTKHRLLIQMTPDLADAVAQAQALKRPKRKTNHLFVTKMYGTPYAYRTVKDMFDRARDLSGVKNCTLHDFRAKAMTDADEEGKNAQNLGGHHDKRTTNIYLRLRKTIKADPPTRVKSKAILDKP